MDKIRQRLLRLSESDPDNTYHKLNHLRYLARLGEVFLFEDKDKVVKGKSFNKDVYIYENTKFQECEFSIRYMYIHDTFSCELIDSKIFTAGETFTIDGKADSELTITGGCIDNAPNIKDFYAKGTYLSGQTGPTGPGPCPSGVAYSGLWSKELYSEKYYSRNRRKRYGRRRFSIPRSLGKPAY